MAWWGCRMLPSSSSVIGGRFGRGPRRLVVIAAAVSLAVAAGLAFLSSAGSAAAAVADAVRAAAVPIVPVSGACAGQNAEVVEATNAPYVFQAWIGCGGIGFARSSDGGASYSAAAEMPGSGGGWDPSIAVGPTGTVYVAYMLSS